MSMTALQATNQDTATLTFGPVQAFEGCSGVMHSTAGSCIMGQEDELVPTRSKLRACCTEQAFCQALGLRVQV